MMRIAKEILFYAVAAVIIIPAPTLWLAWMTGQTLAEVLYR